MTDFLHDSADTWSSREQPTTGLPPDLIGYQGRWTGLLRRFRVRKARADAVFDEMMHPNRGLPVAPGKTVTRFVWGLLAARWQISVLLVLVNIAASYAGVLIPRLLGDLIDDVVAAPSNIGAQITSVVWLAVGVVLAQTVLAFLARVLATIFGQDILAEAREYVVRFVLRLPLSRVESASTGDLVTRVTRDVSEMSQAVRWGLPNVMMAGITVLATLVGVVTNSLILAIPTAIALGLMAWVIPVYLRDAPAGYLTEGQSYSEINSTLTESVEGARTVEALRLGAQRDDKIDTDTVVSAEAERYTMGLRNRLFLGFDFANQFPVLGVIIVAAIAYPAGWVTLGQITAALLYAQQMISPMDRLLDTLDIIQVGAASTARLLGIAEVPPDRYPTGIEPDGSELVGHDLRFAYREDHDVLHGIDLDLLPGERLAIVGPSGSGKSTLSRLLAGINAPRTGEVTVGAANVMDLPLERLRVEVALVTQEHHVFVGSIRDNVALARETTATDEQVEAALAAVDADWVAGLPSGINTLVGSGNLPLTPAQAQQIALARLVLADPHTLVLDEATSLIDPRTARHLEASMASLLTGRTVVAIAHRLHTAHDADRIAVVIDGQIAELGSHDDLMRADGEYAALWRAWRS